VTPLNSTMGSRPGGALEVMCIPQGIAARG
jgi:hypothetical protein